MRRIIAFLVALIGSAAPLVGCGATGAPSGNGSVPTLSIPELQDHTGVSFPDNAVVLYSSNNSRDSYRRWTVFASLPIKMPIHKAVGVKEYLPMPLENSVRLVEETLNNRTVQGPKAAYHSEWKYRDLTFRGTLVRCQEGDYLVLQQFSAPK